jgi:hypothetical protein
LQNKPKVTRLIEIGGVINKARIVQGWNVLSPAETLPLAEVWAEQLDRHDVPNAIYGHLIDRAIDRRLSAFRKEQQPPPFTVELIIACFEDYIADKLVEAGNLKRRLREYQSRIELAESYLGEFVYDVRFSRFISASLQKQGWERSRNQIISQNEAASIEEAIEKLQVKRDAAQKNLDDFYAATPLPEERWTH